MLHRHSLERMADFRYDVFVSHGAAHAGVARSIGDRLRSDGLRVRLDYQGVSGEEALEQSRVLVLCLSTNAFGAEWPRLHVRLHPA